MQYNVSSPQTRFNSFFFSTISYRNSQLMFFSLGNYLTRNSYWMKRNVEIKQEKRWDELVWKAKETKLCLSLVESLSDILVNEHTNPCTHTPKLNSAHPPPLQKKQGGGILDTHPATWSIKVFFLFFFVAVAIISPIYWWAKNTIISKINATLSQNNEQ